MKQMILALIFTVAAISIAPAQNTAEPALATRQDILNLFEIMRLHEQMRPTMDTMVKQQSAILRDRIKRRYPQITEQRLQRYDAVLQEGVSEFPVDAILEDMVPVYQKHLTKPDVEAMSTFYSSPTGQKLLTEIPAMTSEAMQVAYNRMQQQMDEITDRIEKMMQEENHRARPAPKPKPRAQPQSLKD